MEKLKKIIESKQDARILDIGTGRGGFIQIINHVTQSFGEIVGIDTSQKAVDAAKQSFDDSRISFVKMDAMDMTFDDNSFDIVCLSNSLHHLDDVGAIVSEMERVLSPDGYLLFNEMYKDVESEKQITHVRMHHFWAEVDRMNGVTHNETMERSEIIKLLEKTSDYTAVDTWDMNFNSDEEPREISEEEYKFLLDTLDRSLERVKETDQFERLAKQADILKQRLKDIGFESAAQLVVVLQKT